MFPDQLKKKIEQKFPELFQTKPNIYAAPGRINIIGEHTDYNMGFVMPAAIDKYIVFAVQMNSANVHRFYSIDYNQYQEVQSLSKDQKLYFWAKYLMGVLAQFEKEQPLNTCFDVVFGGDIPLGAGLSSSAALESGMATAVNHLLGLNKEPLELVKLAQKAEHEYAGVMCGIMDQYASVFGKKNHVFKLDCRTNTHHYFPLELGDYELWLVNTKVKHSLASSEYNDRRAECERAVSYFQTHDSGIQSLSDVSLELINQHPQMPDAVSYKRSKFIVEELLRVDEASRVLDLGNLEELGKLLYQTHHGLQHEYEVSCQELDFLVDETRIMPQVLGARMMGGGFGGCTLNLVHKDFSGDFEKKLTTSYQNKFSIAPEFYLVQPEDGARLVS